MHNPTVEQTCAKGPQAAHFHVRQPLAYGKLQMTDDRLEQLRILMTHPFHYIRYPEKITPDWWVDASGQRHLMMDMGLDHLKACIRKVEDDIAQFERSGRSEEIVEAILPHAKQKLAELKAAFKSKVQL